MGFSIDDLEETLALQEVAYEERIIDEESFSDFHEDEMEKESEEIMMDGNAGLLEEVYVVANGAPSERKLIIMSGGMSFIYQAEPNVPFQFLDIDSGLLFTMSYFWDDMIESKT